MVVETKANPQDDVTVKGKTYQIHHKFTEVSKSLHTDMPIQRDLAVLYQPTAHLTHSKNTVRASSKKINEEPSSETKQQQSLNNDVLLEIITLENTKPELVCGKGIRQQAK